MKRIISFIMVLAMLVGVMPISAGAEEALDAAAVQETTAESVPEEVTEASTEPPATSEAVEETQSQVTVETQPPAPAETELSKSKILSWEEYRYTLLADGTVSICGFTGTPEDADKPFLVEVPDAIQGAAVTEIAERAFAGNEAINAMLLTETIQVIGSNAFEDCGNLKVIAFRGDAPSFGESLVKGCDNLTEIDVLENRDFSALKELLEIDLNQETAQSVQFQSFENDAALEEYTTSLYNDGAGNTLPQQSHTSVSAMAATTTVASGTCGDNLTWTLDDAGTLTISGTGEMNHFSNSSPPWYGRRDDIVRVKIQDGVTSIGSCAFIACSMTSITIPDSVTRIGSYAFQSCSNLTSITLPDSITSIGFAPFYDCINLTSAVLPGGVTSTGESAFYHCSNLTSVTIPDSITYIEKSAFSGCSSLTSITLPGSVTSIGEWAFGGCESLRSIAIPDSVITIGRGAFVSCNQLADVYYTGTEEQWAQISINNNYGDNSPLTSATIHYNSSNSEATQHVYYFMSWDADHQIAHWGVNSSSIAELKSGSQVTEETDTSFLENIDDLVGSYVLVETKSRSDGITDPDILLSIKPVETRLGIVKTLSAAEKAITIDDTTYLLTDWTVSTVQAGDVVMYHLYEGKIVGTVTAQGLPMSGTVTEWNAETRQITIGSDRYTLTAFADAMTLDALGDTGEKKLSIVYFMDGGVVYKVRPYATEMQPYEAPPETFEHDPAKFYLSEYRTDWEKAYENFISAVGKALDNYAGKTEVTKEHAIEAEAARMKKHDQSSSDRYISGALGQYENAAYKALATYFYEEVSQYQIPDLSSVDVTDTMAGAQIVNTIRKNIGGNSKEYVINGVTFEIVPAINAMGTTFGKMVINGNQMVVICSTRKECEDTISAYVDELRDLSTSSIYKAVSAVYTDILGKSLSSLTSDYLDKVAAKIEKKCAVTLAEEFNLAGVGDLFESIDTCYTYYSWVSNAVNTAETEDIQEAVSNIINLKFEDTSIKDAAVKSAMKQLKKASDKMNRAFNEYLEGTIVKKENSFLRMLIGCPVNVAVYNSAGEQIGYIGEDDLWYADSLIINRIGSAKEIIMLDDTIPSLVITATDYGEMSCTIEEYDDISSPIGRLNYYGIPLTPGQEFSVALMGNVAEHAESLTIESGSETIRADEYVAVSDNAAVSITCACEGSDNAEICGTGTYIRGDVAVLCAKPQDGCEFIGWYEDGTLVSESTAYEFTVKEDRALTAKFRQNELVHVDVTSGDGGVVIGGGTYNKGQSVYVLSIPSNGYAFYGWYSGSEVLSNEREYCIEAQSDISLEAKFVPHEHQYEGPTFLWTEDNTCTAIFACAGCDSEKCIECTISSTKILGTEHEAGKTVYTATVTFNGQTFTDTRELTEPSIQIAQDYITLPIGSSTQLDVEASSDALLDIIQWSAEDATGTDTPQTVLSIDSNGVIMAERAGTAYVIASVTVDGVTYSDRCRVDVTAQTSSAAVQGVQLGTTALTTELFKTDYASFDVVLLLKQNESRIMSADAISPDSAAPEDNGVAISSARFEDEQMDALFALAVKDDRTLLVVPRQTAVDNPNTVGKSYSGKVIVNVGGEEFTTDSSLKLTVKKTMPKLKAASLSFNSFYTNQAQPIVITGATVTGISRNTVKDTAKTVALPTWLILSDGVLTLTDDAPAKSASGSAYVLVETEEWAMPIAVTVPVKLAYKAPGLKLSASSVTFANAGSSGVSLKLLCSGKADTLASLNVSGIRAPEGFDVSNFNRVDGSFTLVPNGAIVPGTMSLVVSFGDTDKTVALKLKVSAKAVTLSAKPGTVTLNSVVGDSAVIQLTASPVDYQITAPTFRLIDSSGAATDQLDFVYSGGTVTIKTNASTRPGATYKLYVAAPGSKEAVITVKTLAEKNSKPTLSAKVTGAIDLSFPESYAAVVPSFRNYSSGLCKLESWTVTESKGKTNLGDATGSFELDYRSGQYRLRAKGDLTTGNTYLLAMTFSLDDGSTYSCSAKIPVKRTAVKLKLSKTSLSLNKTIGDYTEVGVTCLTKNYDFKQPMISKVDNLDVVYSNGKLNVAVNENTQYGKTYKVTVRATQADTPVTLTVKIPAQNKSTVTASLKTKGSIDVIRDGTSVTVTPAYKNYAGLVDIEPALTIESFSSKKGEPYQPVSEGQFVVTPNANGSFTIAKVPGALVNPALKYRAKLTFKGGAQPAYVNLTVKNGTVKATLDGTPVLYQIDRNSRGTFKIRVMDETVNPITKVEIRDAKVAALYQIYNYGNGEFAIGFKDNTVQNAKYPTSAALTVFFDGSQKPSASITLKLQIR